MPRILFTALRVAIAIGLLIYLGVSDAVDWSALRPSAAAWPFVFMALVILVIDVVVTAWRLCVLFKPCSLHLSLASSVQLALIGSFFNTCLPGGTGGDMIKIYYAAEGNHGRRTEVATIMLFDRAVGMFALVLWPLLAAPLFWQVLGAIEGVRGLLYVAAAIAAAMLVGFILLLLDGVRHNRFVRWSFQRLPLGSYVGRALDAVRLYRRNVRALMAALAIALLAHSLNVCAMLLLVEAVSEAGATREMSVLIPLGFLANALPVTPGGLGVGEMAFNELFGIAGLTGGVEALLGWRVLMFLVSLLGLALYVRGRKRFIHLQSPVRAQAEQTIRPVETVKNPI